MAIATTQESNYLVNSKFKDGVSGPSKRAFDQFRKRATVAFKAAAVAIAGVTVALAAMTKKTLDSFDEIGKSSDRIGITTDALQLYRFALDKAGISQEQTDKGLLEFQKRFGKAQQGFGAMAESLKRVDAELLENVLASRNATQALDVLFEGLGNTTNQAKKLAIADAAFGKVGLKMTAAFKDGTDGFKEWIKFAQETGVVIREDLIRKAERLNDEMSALGTVMKVSFQTGLIDGFVDDFGGFHEMIVDPDFRTGLETIGEFMGGFLKFMVENSKTIAITSASLAALFLSTAIIGKLGGLKGKVAIIGTLLTTLTAGVLVWREFSEASEKALKKPQSIVIELEKEFKSLKNTTEEVSDTFSNFGDSVGVLTTTILPVIGEMENATKNFTDNAIAGINDYASNVETVAERTQRFFGQSLQGMEDGLVEFAKTGKITFSGFVDSIISDLLRFQIQQTITLPLANFASTFLGSFGGIQGTTPEAIPFGSLSSGLINSGGVANLDGLRAHGGPVFSGGSFLVGERGPEIFNPSRNGTIIPNNALGGGSTVNVTVINQSGGEVQQKQSRNANGGVDIELLISKAVANDISNGGPAHRAIRKTFATNIRTAGR